MEQFAVSLCSITSQYHFAVSLRSMMLVDELVEMLVGQLGWVVDADEPRVAKFVPLYVIFAWLPLIVLDDVD